MNNKLLQWVEKQGYSLEMRAASAFRRVGLDVTQSAHFYDRQGGKDREVDLIAVPRIMGSPPLAHFAVECKSSDKPWVVLLSPDTLRNVPRQICWGVASHEASDTLHTVSTENLEKLPWYVTSDECGYSLRKAFVDRDDGFSAAASVCKAAQYQVFPFQGDERSLPKFAVAFPLVVVDAPIFECRLSADGAIDLAEVSCSEFLHRDRVIYDTLVRIRVIHIDELPRFAEDAYEASWHIQKFMAELEEAYER